MIAPFAGTDRGANIDLPWMIEEFTGFAEVCVNFERLGDDRPKLLRQYFLWGPAEVAEKFGWNPAALAVVLAPFTVACPRYLVNANRYLAMTDEELHELIAADAIRGPKPLDARNLDGDVALFLAGLLKTVKGVRLFYRMAVLLTAAQLQPDLKPYFELAPEEPELS